MVYKKKITGHELIFGICFIMGALLITLLAKGKTPENTLINQSISQTFLEQGWNKKILFLQCLYSRGITMLLLILLAYTSLRKCVFLLVTAWMGLSFGILFKLFFCWYGMIGAGLLIVSILPHFLLYWMAYGLLYWEIEKKRLKMINSPIGLLVAIGVVLVGIFVESYVNPLLVNTYIKIFF